MVPELYHDSLLIPAFVAALSCAVLVGRFGYICFKPPDADPRDQDTLGGEGNVEDLQGGGLLTRIRAHARFHGGFVIFAHRIARFLCCLILLSLTATIAFLHETGPQNNEEARVTESFSSSWSYQITIKAKMTEMGLYQRLLVALCVVYAYGSVLALMCLITKPLVTARDRASRITSSAPYHLSCLLLSILAVFCARDIWPLCTYTLRPLDLSLEYTNIPVKAPLLWSHIGVLVIAAVVLPLSAPRAYVPVDPKNPSPVPNAEQTCSLFSLITYSFLDSIIFKAYRMPHLGFDELPPLSDYDRSTVLREKTFPFLDPFHSDTTNAKGRHIFFSLARVFVVEFAIMTLMVILNTAMDFVAPVGVNRLLNYFETHGEGAFVRPWFWLLWLFFGPLIGFLTLQWYTWISTALGVRLESIITQLVFEHALRVRLHTELEPSSTDDSKMTPRDNTGESGHGPVASSSVTSQSPIVDQGTDTASPKTTFVAKAWSWLRSLIRRKEKTADGTKPIASGEPTQKGKGPANLQGRITNLVTTDLSSISGIRYIIVFLIPVPLEVALSVCFLYAVLGWSAFVGMSAMVLLYPLPGYIARRLQRFQKERMARTDTRVQIVTETMNLIRMIKLFGWEHKMNQRISDKRDEELTYLRKRKLLELISSTINYATLIMKQQLTPSKVFSSMTVFDMLRQRLYLIQYGINCTVEGKVSLDRLDEFLKKSELLDQFVQRDIAATNQGEERSDIAGNLEAAGQTSSSQHISGGSRGCPPPGYESAIGFRDASFTWSAAENAESRTSSTPSLDHASTSMASQRNFMLQIEGELLFRRGYLNLIVGPTGSGKTSLLMALLGEMHFTARHPEAWFQLPRSGGISYAAQESWVQNETIKENILFGAPYEEERYNKVIYQCCLDRDIAMFAAGDKTEIGEKGITLSGGQKARVTLARAIYARTEILLLDDVFAALDVHTSKWIMEKCFSGDLLENRTVILVSHNIALVKPLAGFIVSLSSGRIAHYGSVSEVLQLDKALAREVQEEEEGLKEAGLDLSESAKPENNTAGKLIIEEEVEIGHLGWNALKMYFSGLGGRHPALFFSSYYSAAIMVAVLLVGQTWYLGYWAAQYEGHNPRDVPVTYYLAVYGLLLLAVMLLTIVQAVIFILGTMRASKTLHEKLIQGILGATWRWLDTTPVSRVIARCTQDIRAIDVSVPANLSSIFDVSLDVVIKFCAILLFAPIFLVPGAILLMIGIWCGQIYMAAQLSVKREMSKAKAPVLGHFGAAVAGLVSIRAYGAQTDCKKEAHTRIDRYTRAARTFWNLNRWVGVRLEFVSRLFVASLAAYFLYAGQTSANTGFSLNMAVGFSSVMMFLVRLVNDFEVEGNSLERIQDYIVVEQEPKPTVQGKPPAYWPASGDIVVENLSARYSMDGPNVLHDISFRIKSGERIGVVGRTGSGKSSLTLSLLRCILTDGTVYFDGILTSSINLEALRSNITLIPQVPELLSGTLRQNIDPFGQHDDATLNDALRAAGLFSLQSDTDEDRITLDTSIASGGGNLSVGQRQILALARAIVRRSKLLILDEATSAIDYKTDAVIQSSLRNELLDVTVITVAHRLQTIMDADKIMVLDAGRIVEFDSPMELLKKTNGMLRALVDESGDRDALIAIAKGQASRPSD